MYNDIANSDLESLVVKTMSAIKNYIHGRYYASKNTRIEQLKKNLKIRDMAMNIMVITSTEQTVQPIQSAASKLAAYMDFEDIFDGIKTASELLAVVCIEADIFDIIPAQQSETGSLMIKPNIMLEPETLEYIHGTKYLPPMICKPQTINSNTDNGHLTKNESVILGSDNHHEEHQALDVLNIVQEIPLSLDTDVLKMKEESKKPLDTPEKINNFQRMVGSSQTVYNDLLEQGNKFYLTWKYDKRGRAYSQGYHVHIQATEYKKALINLTNEYVITGV